MRYNTNDAMDGFIKAGVRSEIPAGSMKTVRVNGKPVALANIDGEFFAVSDICSHAECSLGSNGFLDGNVITCACHGAQFDATNGKVLSLPAPTDIPYYEVKIVGEEIHIKM